MIARNIDQITEADLLDLENNSVAESKTIEYKQELPGNSDDDKKEFLADVSSFANASGGDLIFGIIEDRDTGIPERLEGLEIANVDQEILRLESSIRDGIEPRIWGITVRDIDLSNSKKALIIRIPKSWRSPHRVSLRGRGHGKFFLRSTNGKYPMDVGELRIAFNLSETITERIRNFRVDRIAKIFADKTPVPFYDTAKIALHLIPFVAFDPAQNYDIGRIASERDKMWPIDCFSSDDRYNLDGFLRYHKDHEGLSNSYVQLFKNGIIEAVNGGILKDTDGNFSIPCLLYERELIKSLKQYISVLQDLIVEPPIFIFLTLIGVKGYSMSFNRDGRDEVHEIDRDILLLPEVIIESYDFVAENVLRPCFDSIWNACGLPRSLNYDENGNWLER